MTVLYFQFCVPKCHLRHWISLAPAFTCLVSPPLLIEPTIRIIDHFYAFFLFRSYLLYFTTVKPRRQGEATPTPYTSSHTAQRFFLALIFAQNLRHCRLSSYKSTVGSSWFLEFVFVPLAVARNIWTCTEEASGHARKKHLDVHGCTRVARKSLLVPQSEEVLKTEQKIVRNVTKGNPL